MDKKTQVIIFVVAGLFLVCFGSFVWPTRYLYTHTRFNEATFPVRIDRFTGKTEVLYGLRGWRTMGQYVELGK